MYGEQGKIRPRRPCRRVADHRQDDGRSDDA